MNDARNDSRTEPRAATTRKRATRALMVAVAASLSAGAMCASRADAQRLDPRKPHTFLVGRPQGAAPTQRGDARRSGGAREVLPRPPLRMAWRRLVGIPIEQPALAGADGSIVVVTARGDVVLLDDGGEEVARASAGAAASPATLTSDGAAVFTTTSGDVTFVRPTAPRPVVSVRVGDGSRSIGAPLSLDDGGVALAAGRDLVVVDSEGGTRARVTLPEAAALPLLAADGRILAVSTSGKVFGWVPGREAVRLGSFDATVDGAAALASSRSLLGVVEASRLVEIDLVRGSRTTLASSPQGLLLGPPAIKVDGAGWSTALLAMSPTRVFAIAVDRGGQEILRAPIATVTPSVLPDGGPAPLLAPPHTGVFVDPTGAIAFASPDGTVGVVSPEGAVTTFGELVCSKTSRSSGIAGLTPFGRDGLLVTCENGLIVLVAGPDRPARAAKVVARPARPVRPASPPPPTPLDDQPTDDDDDGDDEP